MFRLELLELLGGGGGEENVEEAQASDAGSSVSVSVEDLLVDFFWPDYWFHLLRILLNLR